MTDARSEETRMQIAALWRATFGEQPAIEADTDTMLQILVSCLEDVGPWELRPMKKGPTSEGRANPKNRVLSEA
jgi:hypothetical protein